MVDDHSFFLFAGSSHLQLAQEIATGLGKKLGKVSISTFPDSEIGIEVLENVRGRDVFVLQTIAQRPNHYLMELLILVDALKRASAGSITAVIPYFGYARQDRKDQKDKGHVPITAKLVANLLQTAGVGRVISMDLHAQQIQGFFDIPVDHLFARPLQAEALKSLGLDDYVIVAPDLGSIKLARAFAGQVGGEFAIVDKRRVDAEHVEDQALIGSVDGKRVLLLDDMVSTGETFKAASTVCLHFGAKEVVAAATHGLLVEGALKGSAIQKLWVTNTIPLSDQWSGEKMIESISVAPLFSQAIQTIVSAGSISSLQK